MDLTRELKQREEFRNILRELARSQEFLQDEKNRSDIYKRLESLYDAELPENRFRHFYSDIFSVLTDVQNDSALGDIDILGQNLALIREKYEPQNESVDGVRGIDVSDAIKKLYDHVSLDIARMRYSDAGDREISGEGALTELQNKIKKQKQDIEKSSEEINEINKHIISVESELDNSKKEYIAILGIFAAVVLAFTGGIAFSTSVLNNIAQASVYRTIIVSLIIGLVLINILFGLFYYINLLVNKNNKLFPLILSNGVIIVLLIGTIIAWSCGWVENRNKRIEISPTRATEEERIMHN